MDVLKLIRDLGTSEASLGGDAPQDIKQLDFTNWLKSTTQEFELSVQAESHDFEYKLHIEQAYGDVKPRIIRESATCDGRQLFSRDLEGVSLEKRVRLVDVGLNTKTLQLRFDAGEGHDAEPYFFHQLSDGEKALVGLYMVRAAMETNAANIIVIDEPDNFKGTNAEWGK